MKPIPVYRPLIREFSESYMKKTLCYVDDYHNYITMEERLEKKVCDYLETKHSVATTNYTASLHLSLLTLDLKRGDKIICSVNSFPTIAEVVRYFDAEPIFVDIDIDDFNIDINKLERVLEKNNHKKLKAVIVEHIGGQSADLDPICELAKKYNVKIINNCSCALGLTYKGQKLSCVRADISCFGHTLQTRNLIASGSVMTVRDEEMAQRARRLRNHGIKSDDWDSFGNVGYVYDVAELGVGYSISELAAAFSLDELGMIEKAKKRRLEIVEIYNEELSQCPQISVPVQKRDHMYTMYIIKVAKNRDKFAKFLMENGIFTSINYMPIHLLTYYKNKYSLRVGDFPVALQNYQHILSLPMYSMLTDDMVFYICDTIKKYCKTHG